METELEKVLMTFYKDVMIDFIYSKPEVFEELLDLSIANKQPYSWRAAWLLGSCIEKNDSRLQNYISKIIKALPSKKDGHQRELIKILSVMELTEEQEGYFFDICLTIWQSIEKQSSVRYTAFISILKITEKYPELLGEILFLTEKHYLDTLSPGIKNSIFKNIKKYQNKI